MSLLTNRQVVAVTLICTSAMLLNIMNVQGTLIALPTIGEELRISLPNQQWLLSSYALTFGSLLLLFGRIADLFGPKRVFCAGMTCLGISSIAVAVAPSEISIDIFRGLQGVGSALSIPSALGILGSFEPGRRKTIAFATFSAGAPVGASFGSIFAGVFTQYTPITWRGLFYLSAALSLVVVVLAFFFVPTPPPSDPIAPTKENRSIDWTGAAMISVGLLLVTFSLADSGSAPKGWATPYIPVLLIVGLVLIGGFWAFELRVERLLFVAVDQMPTVPLMKPSLWWKGKFAVMQLIATLAWSAFSSFLFFATQYYQTYLQLSPIQTTLRFLTCAIVGVGINVVVALISSKVSAQYLIMIGALGTSLAPLLFAVQSYSSYSGYWAFEFPAMALAVTGADFIFSLGIMYVSRIASADEQALAGGIFNSTTQIGTAIGLAIMTIIQNAITEKETLRLGFPYSTNSADLPPEAVLKGLQAAFFACFAFGMLAFAMATFGLRGIGVVGETDNVESETATLRDETDDEEGDRSEKV